VEIREKVAFTADRIAHALSSLQAQSCISECLILSTCNRTEIYTVFNEGCFEPDVLRHFVAEHNDLCCDDVAPYLYQLANRQAVEHLFRVVGGLDSMVIGENQIAAQVKEAYRYATTVKTTGPILNKLFHIAFRVSKKIRTQTGIGAGSLSVAQVACDLAEKIFKHLSERSVLLIGAGENSELTAKNLQGRGAKRLFITNRTGEKAEALAKRIGAKAVPYEDLVDTLGKVDIVITSTGAAEAIIRQEQIASVVSKRQVPLFMIDMAIPRDIDPDVDELDNVFLYDMDALQQIVEESLKRRSVEAHKAKRIVDDEVEKFVAWHQGEKATPTIVEMQELFEQVRRAELEKIRDDLSSEQFEKIDGATKAMMNKVLYAPIHQLRKAAKKGDDRGLIKTIRSVLGLSEESS
jgi:glutamyl-tRNA reductase